MRTAALGLMVCLFLALPAHAMRCGSKIVKEGDYAARVIHVCGEPDYVDEHVNFRYGHLAHSFSGLHGPDLVAINVEVWTYNFGPHKLMRRLRFENGRLISIQTLGYGYHPRH